MTPDVSAATVLIVNPASGGGATRRRWPELEATIRRELGDFKPLFTERTGHATELTRQALQDGARLVIAMGGDGTINEVTNGFFQSTGTVAQSAPVGGEAPDDLCVAPDAVLAVLPMGTGGDFIKTTGTSKDIAVAARAIASATPRTVDVGRLDFTAHDGRSTRRYFLNIASFGISGLVDRYVNDSSKVLGGKASFFLSTVRASLAYTNVRCRISVDDGPEIERAVYALAVANGRYFGGGMKIAPDAALDDGRFDVVTIGDVGMVTMLMQSSKIYKGTHVDLPFVRVEHGKKLVATPAPGTGEVLLDVDGEAPGRLPATFRLLPKAIRLQG